MKHHGIALLSLFAAVRLAAGTVTLDAGPIQSDVIGDNALVPMTAMSVQVLVTEFTTLSLNLNSAANSFSACSSVTQAGGDCLLRFTSRARFSNGDGSFTEIDASDDAMFSPQGRISDSFLLDCYANNAISYGQSSCLFTAQPGAYTLSVSIMDYEEAYAGGSPVAFTDEAIGTLNGDNLQGTTPEPVAALLVLSGLIAIALRRPLKSNHDAEQMYLSRSLVFASRWRSARSACRSKVS